MAIIYFISGEFYETTGTFVSLHKYICLNNMFIRAPMIKIEDFFHGLIPYVMILYWFHCIETKSAYPFIWRNSIKNNWRYSDGCCHCTTCNHYFFPRRPFLPPSQSFIISWYNCFFPSDYLLCNTYARLFSW